MMKKLIGFFCFASLAALLFSFEKSKCVKGTIIRDCTGTYLQIDQKDYRVCNPKKVEFISDGAAVKASYKLIQTCEKDTVKKASCLMFHESAGVIEVTKIKTVTSSK
jgi:hypothetical protein